MDAPHRTAPHRTAPHRTAPHRTAPHRTAPHRTAPHRTFKDSKVNVTNSIKNKLYADVSNWIFYVICYKFIIIYCPFFSFLNIKLTMQTNLKITTATGQQ